MSIPDKNEMREEEKKQIDQEASSMSGEESDKYADWLSGEDNDQIIIPKPSHFQRKNLKRKL